MYKLLLAAVFLTAALTPVLAAPAVSVSPKDITASPGQEFSVNVSVDPAGNETYGVQFDLLFNKDVLEGISIDQGKFLSQDGATTIAASKKIDNANGKVSYAETRVGVPNGVKNPGILAIIKFKVKATAQAGNSGISLENVLLSDQNVQLIPNVVLVNSNLNVPGAAVPGEKTPVKTATPAPTPAVSKISKELQKELDRASPDTKIPIIINLGGINVNQSIIDIINYLSASGIDTGDESKVKILTIAEAVAYREATPALISLLNNEDYVKSIEPDREQKAYAKATPAQVVTTTPSTPAKPQASPAPKQPGFESILLIVAILSLYYMGRKR